MCMTCACAYRGMPCTMAGAVWLMSGLTSWATPCPTESMWPTSSWICQVQMYTLRAGQFLVLTASVLIWHAFQLSCSSNIADMSSLAPAHCSGVSCSCQQTSLTTAEVESLTCTSSCKAAFFVSGMVSKQHCGSG